MSSDRERSFTILSQTALAVDILVVFLVLSVLSKAAIVTSQFQTWRISTDLFPLFALPVGLVLHYLVVEIVFSGHSIGRLCTGLNYVRTGIGTTAPLAARLQRFFAMVIRLGAGTFSLHGRPARDRNPRCALKSDWIGVLGAEPVSRAREPQPSVRPSQPASMGKSNSRASLLVVSGPAKGKSALLSAAINNDGAGIFLIGRDPQKSHLALKSDLAVSRIQNRIAVKNGQYLIVDGPAANEPSAHGTKLNGRPVASASATLLTNGSLIEVGQSKIVFRLN